VASRDNEIIVHFVPVTFEPGNSDSLRKLEEMNGLATCSISKAKWAKSIQNRSANQTVASLLVYLTDPNAANTLLVSGVLVEGKRVQTAKAIKEETRCYHCQTFGHMTNGCPRLKQDGNDVPTCGKCSERHHTRECVSETLKCTNCKEEGHASNDRTCPIFIQKCEALNKRSPTNQLPYFPTDENWTW
ncbi:hypothetical protein BT96DRAFT_775378, partial [Gymnopus androsaceus JB14]